MPSADRDPEKVFATHAHYVDAFSRLAGYSTADRWAGGLSALPGDVDQFLGTQPPASRTTSVDVAQVARSLRSAWGTELLLLRQLELVEKVPEMSRVVAAWAAVQTYYTGYHATQALIVAEGRERPPEHPKTQRGYDNAWAGRSGAIEPWTMTFCHRGHENCVSAINDQVSNLSRPDNLNCASLAAKALRTTWEKSVDERRLKAGEAKANQKRREFDAGQQERAANGKKLLQVPTSYGLTSRRLTPAERQLVAERVGRVGLLHYLYRLRVSANYVDVDVFAQGPVGDWDGYRFVADLTYLASALVVVHEHRVRHQLGLQCFRDMQSTWRNGPGQAFADVGPSADYRHL